MSAVLSPSQADDIRALLIDAMPPDALPSCLKPQATVVSLGCPQRPENAPETLNLPPVSQVSASVVSSGAAGGVVISPSPSPSCLSAASSIDNLTTPLGELAVGGAAGSVDVASVSDRKEGEGTDVRCEFWGGGAFLFARVRPLLAAQDLPNDVTVCAALLDMTINQFLKSLGLEHLRDIFQREQVTVAPVDPPECSDGVVDLRRPCRDL